MLFIGRNEINLVRAQERRHVNVGQPAMQNPEDEPPRQRRRLSDLIRENNERFNTFVTRTEPRLMRHYGIDYDD